MKKRKTEEINKEEERREEERGRAKDGNKDRKREKK